MMKKNVSQLVPLLNHQDPRKSIVAVCDLEEMVIAASAKKETAERLALELAAALTLAKDDVGRIWVLTALQKLGCAATVPLILPMLAYGDPIFTYALNALRSLKSPVAWNAMEYLVAVHAKGEDDGLPNDTCRRYLLLAALENPAPSPELLRYVLGQAEDCPEIRRGLAEQGCWEAFPLFLESIVSAQSRTEAALAMRDMAKFFEKTTAPREMRRGFALEFLQAMPSPASLDAVMKSCGANEETAEILQTAIMTGDQILRASALSYCEKSFAGALETEKMIAFAVKSLQGKGEVRCQALADFLLMLGRRGDRTALNFLTAKVHDDSAVVRQAARCSLQLLDGISAERALLSQVLK